MPVSKTANKTDASEVGRHIAREAARLFAANGFDATSVREIVEAAGVTKPTLYYYFGSKEGLAQALLSDPHLALIEQIDGLLESESDPILTLRRLIDAHFDFCREDPDRMRFALALVFGPPGSHLAEVLCGFHETLMGQISRVVELIVRAGIVAPARGLALQSALSGRLFMSMIQYLYKCDGMNPGTSECLVREVLYGFADENLKRSGDEHTDVACK